MEEWARSTIELLLNDFFSLIISGYSSAIEALGTIDLTTTPLTTIATSTGQTLTALFFAMEAFKEVSLSRFETLEDAVKLMFRFVIAKVIIENSSGIVAMIYKLFFVETLPISTFAGNLQSEMTSALSINFADTVMNLSQPGLLGMGYLISAVFLLIIVLFIIIMLTKLLIQIVGIFFEIGVHICVAPVALSTLCNDTARSTGISFIKSFSAVCMQIIVMNCCLNVYNVLSGSSGVLAAIKGSFTVGAGSSLEGTFVAQAFLLASPLIMLAILSSAISKSGEMTKRMLGA